MFRYSIALLAALLFAGPAAAQCANGQCSLANHPVAHAVANTLRAVGNVAKCACGCNGQCGGNCGCSNCTCPRSAVTRSHSRQSVRRGVFGFRRCGCRR